MRRKATNQMHLNGLERIEGCFDVWNNEIYNNAMIVTPSSPLHNSTTA